MAGVGLRLAWWLLFGVFVAIGTLSAAGASMMASDAYGKLKTHSPASVDFAHMFAGYSAVVRDPHETYDEDHMLQVVSSVQGLQDHNANDELKGVLQYYNPPFFLLLMSPLTLLDAHIAYLVSISLNLVALAGLAVVTGACLRWRQPQTLIFISALLAFPPVYISLYNSQPTILIALALLASFLAMESGRGLLAAILIGLTGAKPQWMVLPGVALIADRLRNLFPLAIVGGLLLLSPFVFLGLNALLDYIHLLLGRANADADETSYAIYMFNWLGFFKAWTGEVQIVPTILASLLTLAAFAFILPRGDRHLSWAAAILVTLLVFPHTHSFEWIAAVPAALRAGTVALLLATHLAVTTSVLQVGLAKSGEAAFYWAVPMGFVIVLWCAALPLLEELQLKSWKAYRLPV